MRGRSFVAIPTPITRTCRCISDPRSRWGVLDSGSHPSVSPTDDVLLPCIPRPNHRPPRFSYVIPKLNPFYRDYAPGTLATDFVTPTAISYQADKEERPAVQKEPALRPTAIIDELTKRVQELEKELSVVREERDRIQKELRTLRSSLPSETRAKTVADYDSDLKVSATPADVYERLPPKKIAHPSTVRVPDSSKSPCPPAEGLQAPKHPGPTTSPPAPPGATGPFLKKSLPLIEPEPQGSGDGAAGGPEKAKADSKKSAPPPATPKKLAEPSAAPKKMPLAPKATLSANGQEQVGEKASLASPEPSVPSPSSASPKGGPIATSKVADVDLGESKAPVKIKVPLKKVVSPALKVSSEIATEVQGTEKGQLSKELPSKPSLPQKVLPKKVEGPKESIPSSPLTPALPAEVKDVPSSKDLPVKVPPKAPTSVAEASPGPISPAGSPSVAKAPAKIAPKSVVMKKAEPQPQPSSAVSNPPSADEVKTPPTTSKLPPKVTPKKLQAPTPSSAMSSSSVSASATPSAVGESKVLVKKALPLKQPTTPAAKPPSAPLASDTSSPEVHKTTPPAVKKVIIGKRFIPKSPRSAQGEGAEKATTEDIGPIIMKEGDPKSSGLSSKKITVKKAESESTAHFGHTGESSSEGEIAVKKVPPLKVVKKVPIGLQPKKVLGVAPMPSPSNSESLRDSPVAAKIMVTEAQSTLR